MQPPYITKFYDITDLIKEVKSSLKYNNHFSALILTSMLISECANIEYPDEWFEKNAKKMMNILKNISPNIIQIMENIYVKIMTKKDFKCGLMIGKTFIIIKRT